MSERKWWESQMAWEAIVICCANTARVLRMPPDQIIKDK